MAGVAVAPAPGQYRKDRHAPSSILGKPGMLNRKSLTTAVMLGDVTEMSGIDANGLHMTMAHWPELAMVF